jgi:hypothetical protein
VTLIVVGSGRCGTRSFAEFFDTIHEPNPDPVVQTASSYSHGWFTDEQAATLLSTCRWPNVIVDYKQSELMPVTARMDPLPVYLWLVRNPADTVASMVAKGWYDPADDVYPLGYMKIYKLHEDGIRPILWASSRPTSGRIWGRWNGAAGGGIGSIAKSTVRRNGYRAG